MDIETSIELGTAIAFIFAIGIIITTVIINKKWQKQSRGMIQTLTTPITESAWDNIRQMMKNNKWEDKRNAINHYLRHEYLAVKDLKNLGLNGQHPLLLRQRNQWHKAEQLTHFIEQENRTEYQINNFAYHLMLEEMSNLDGTYLGMKYDPEINYFELYHGVKKQMEQTLLNAF